jgi:hypothetical protein
MEMSQREKEKVFLSLHVFSIMPLFSTACLPNPLLISPLPEAGDQSKHSIVGGMRKTRKAGKEQQSHCVGGEIQPFSSLDRGYLGPSSDIKARHPASNSRCGLSEIQLMRIPQQNSP